MSEDYSNNSEFRKSVGRLAESFDRWWSAQSAADLTLETVPEIVAHVYCNLRMHLPEEEVMELLYNTMRWTEQHIQAGDIELELLDGSRFAYRSAEQYEGQEELRDMLIALSRGNTFSDAEIDKFLDES